MDTLQDMNLGENLLIDCVMSRKLKHFGRIKSHSGFGKNSNGRLMPVRAQGLISKDVESGLEDTCSMKMHEDGE